jgi:hypothetical protein
MLLIVSIRFLRLLRTQIKASSQNIGGENITEDIKLTPDGLNRAIDSAG